MFYVLFGCHDDWISLRGMGRVTFSAAVLGRCYFCSSVPVACPGLCELFTWLDSFMWKVWVFLSIIMLFV